MKEENRLQAIEKALLEIKQLLNQIIGDRPLNVTQQTTGFLNVKQAAQLLGVEPSTIYVKCHHDNLPHRRVGKFYKFDKEELLQWMNNPKIPAEGVDQYVDKYLQTNPFRG
jgi:excisionase family DNA binding protein